MPPLKIVVGGIHQPPDESETECIARQLVTNGYRQFADEVRALWLENQKLRAQVEEDARRFAAGSKWDGVSNRRTGDADRRVDPACVCKINFRDLIKEYGHLIGRKFYERTSGKAWLFFGIVWGDDDLYYGMAEPGEWKLHLYSCVGSLEEGWGFTLATKGSPDERDDTN